MSTEIKSTTSIRVQNPPKKLYEAVRKSAKQNSRTISQQAKEDLLHYYKLKQ